MTISHKDQVLSACLNGDLPALQNLFQTLPPEKRRELLEFEQGAYFKIVANWSFWEERRLPLPESGQWHYSETDQSRKYAACLGFLIAALDALPEKGLKAQLFSLNPFVFIRHCAPFTGKTPPKTVSNCIQESTPESLFRERKLLFMLIARMGYLDPLIQLKNKICPHADLAIETSRTLQTTHSFLEEASWSPLLLSAGCIHLLAQILFLSETAQDTFWEQFDFGLSLKPEAFPLAQAALQYYLKKDLQDQLPLNRWQRFLTLFRPVPSPRVKVAAKAFLDNGSFFSSHPQIALALIHSGRMNVNRIDVKTGHSPLAAFLIEARAADSLTPEQVNSTWAVLTALLAQGANIKKALRQSELTQILTPAQVRCGDIFKPQQLTHSSLASRSQQKPLLNPPLYSKAWYPALPPFIFWAWGVAR